MFLLCQYQLFCENEWPKVNVILFKLNLQYIQALTLAPKRVILAEAIVPLFAVVTSLTLDIGLTATLTTNHSEMYISMTVTPPSIQRTHWVTITSCTQKNRKRQNKWKIIQT